MPTADLTKSRVLVDWCHLNLDLEDEKELQVDMGIIGSQIGYHHHF